MSMHTFADYSADYHLATARARLDAAARAERRQRWAQRLAWFRHAPRASARRRRRLLRRYFGRVVFVCGAFALLPLLVLILLYCWPIIEAFL